jgi:hypothetical protein
VKDTSPTIYQALDTRVGGITAQSGTVEKQVAAVCAAIETRRSMLESAKLVPGEEAEFLSVLASALKMPAEERRRPNAVIREHLNETIRRTLRGAVSASMKDS